MTRAYTYFGWTSNPIPWLFGGGVILLASGTAYNEYLGVPAYMLLAFVFYLVYLFDW